MNNCILLILASGKASRFGGYPKAFCKIDNEFVAQHSIDMAGQFFDEIYLTLNEEIYPEFHTDVTGCQVNAIKTGVGDAHSLLRALRQIRRMNRYSKYVVVCWGDTVFLSDAVFQTAKDLTGMFHDNAGYVICAEDENPYAWFETEGQVVKNSYFCSQDKVIGKGMHDQSVFVFDIEMIISQLEAYRDFLGITEEMKYTDKREMKLLYSFSYFYKNDMKPVLIHEIESGLVMSFNTFEEFNNIKACWQTR